MLSVPGSSTHGPLMSFHIREVIREKVTQVGALMHGWIPRAWRTAMGTRPARTTQQDPISKQTKAKKPKQ